MASVPEFEPDLRCEAERCLLSCSALMNAVADEEFASNRKDMQQYCRHSELKSGSVVASVRQCSGLVADVRAADAGTSLMWHGMVLVGCKNWCWCFYTMLCRTWGRDCGISRTWSTEHSRVACHASGVARYTSTSAQFLRYGVKLSEYRSDQSRGYRG